LEVGGPREDFVVSEDREQCDDVLLKAQPDVLAECDRVPSDVPERAFGAEVLRDEDEVSTETGIVDRAGARVSMRLLVVYVG
jgi:hypothetical protein